MKTVKVRFLKYVAGHRFHYGPGDVAHVTEASAKRWLRTRTCEYVGNPAETTTRARRQKAVVGPKGATR